MVRCAINAVAFRKCLVMSMCSCVNVHFYVTRAAPKMQNATLYYDLMSQPITLITFRQAILTIQNIAKAGQMIEYVIIKVALIATQTV